MTSVRAEIPRRWFTGREMRYPGIPLYPRATCQCTSSSCSSSSSMLYRATVHCASKDIILHPKRSFPPTPTNCPGFLQWNDQMKHPLLLRSDLPSWSRWWRKWTESIALPSSPSPSLLSHPLRFLLSFSQRYLIEHHLLMAVWYQKKIHREDQTFGIPRCVFVNLMTNDTQTNTVQGSTTYKAGPRLREISAWPVLGSA